MVFYQDAWDGADHVTTVPPVPDATPATLVVTGTASRAKATPDSNSNIGYSVLLNGAPVTYQNGKVVQAMIFANAPQFHMTLPVIVTGTTLNKGGNTIQLSPILGTPPTVIDFEDHFVLSVLV